MKIKERALSFKAIYNNAIINPMAQFILNCFISIFFIIWTSALVRKS